jgi:hypothetical protein
MLHHEENQNNGGRASLVWRPNSDDLTSSAFQAAWYNCARRAALYATLPALLACVQLPGLFPHDDSNNNQHEIPEPCCWAT